MRMVPRLSNFLVSTSRALEVSCPQSSAPAMMVTGIISAKAHRQETSTSSPPTSGPRPAATP